MEFLLQLFADFLGTPPEEEKNKVQEIIKEKEVSQEATAPLKKEESEDPVLFGLMQFH